MSIDVILPPLSLYIHFPWCVRKCPYCDFNSHEVKTSFDEEGYINALLQDLKNEYDFIQERQVSSIFIGGGTPSLLSAQSIDSLLKGVNQLVTIASNAEVTLEANPGTFEKEKFIDFKSAGINRLSIGVQSFHDHLLKNIGRIHSGKEAIQAIDLAVEIFSKVNIDLMYALPEQTINEARQDVQLAIELGAEHISAYHLTIEPNTAFAYKIPENLPEDETALDIEDTVQQYLIDSGFEHYETSAFTKNKQYCLHNLNYWQFGDYIGIGAGAHGKITHSNTIERTVRKRHPKEYLNGIHLKQGYTERHLIEKTDLPFEFMMNILRLYQPTRKALFTQRTGLDLEIITPILEKAYKENLMEKSATEFITTDLGKKFLNNLLTLFLEESTLQVNRNISLS